MSINDLKVLAKGTPLIKGGQTVYFQGIEAPGTGNNSGTRNLVKVSTSKTGRTSERAFPQALRAA